MWGWTSALLKSYCSTNCWKLHGYFSAKCPSWPLSTTKHPELDPRAIEQGDLPKWIVFSFTSWGQPGELFIWGRDSYRMHLGKGPAGLRSIMLSLETSGPLIRMLLLQLPCALTLLRTTCTNCKNCSRITFKYQASKSNCACVGRTDLWIIPQDGIELFWLHEEWSSQNARYWCWQLYCCLVPSGQDSAV